MPERPSMCIFLERGLFKDIKNHIPMCWIHKYKKTNTQIKHITKCQKDPIYNCVNGVKVLMTKRLLHWPSLRFMLVCFLSFFYYELVFGISFSTNIKQIFPLRIGCLYKIIWSTIWKHPWQSKHWRPYVAFFIPQNIFFSILNLPLHSWFWKSTKTAIILDRAPIWIWTKIRRCPCFRFHLFRCACIDVKMDRVLSFKACEPIVWPPIIKARHWQAFEVDI